MYKWSKTSEQRRKGVHPILMRVTDRALGYGILDLTIPPYGGLRNLSDQKKLVDRGASKTLNSLHRVQPETGFGHAIDVVPYPIDWNDLERFKLMGTLMFKAAMEEGVIIEWGGHWNWKDYPHFQLRRGFRG